MIVEIETLLDDNSNVICKEFAFEMSDGRTPTFIELVELGLVNRSLNYTKAKEWYIKARGWEMVIHRNALVGSI